MLTDKQGNILLGIMGIFVALSMYSMYIKEMVAAIFLATMGLVIPAIGSFICIAINNFKDRELHRLARRERYYKL